MGWGQPSVCWGLARDSRLCLHQEGHHRLASRHKLEAMQEVSGVCVCVCVCVCAPTHNSITVGTVCLLEYVRLCAVDEEVLLRMCVCVCHICRFCCWLETQHHWCLI